MTSIKALTATLLDELNETSDLNPTVTVDRRKLRALLEMIERKYGDNDE